MTLPQLELTHPSLTQANIFHLPQEIVTFLGKTMNLIIISWSQIFKLGKPSKKNWIFYDNLSKGG